jgi:hypothetical protein
MAENDGTIRQSGIVLAAKTQETRLQRREAIVKASTEEKSTRWM